MMFTLALFSSHKMMRVERTRPFDVASSHDLLIKFFELHQFNVFNSSAEAKGVSAAKLINSMFPLHVLDASACKCFGFPLPRKSQWKRRRRRRFRTKLKIVCRLFTSPVYGGIVVRIASTRPEARWQRRRFGAAHCKYHHHHYHYHYLSINNCFDCYSRSSGCSSVRSSVRSVHNNKSVDNRNADYTAKELRFASEGRGAHGPATGCEEAICTASKFQYAGYNTRAAAALQYEEVIETNGEISGESGSCGFMAVQLETPFCNRVIEPSVDFVISLVQQVHDVSSSLLTDVVDNLTSQEMVGVPQAEADEEPSLDIAQPPSSLSHEVAEQIALPASVSSSEITDAREVCHTAVDYMEVHCTGSQVQYVGDNAFEIKATELTGKQSRVNVGIANEFSAVGFPAADCNAADCIVSGAQNGGSPGDEVICPVVRSLVSLVHCLDDWLFDTSTEQMLGYASRMSPRQFPLGMLQNTQVQLAAASVHNHSSLGMRQGEVEGCLHGDLCSIVICPSVESSGVRKNADAPCMRLAIASIGTCPANESLNFRNSVNRINCRNSKTFKMSQELSANYKELANSENKGIGSSEDARDIGAGAELKDGCARTLGSGTWAQQGLRGDIGIEQPRRVQSRANALTNSAGWFLNIARGCVEPARGQGRASEEEYVEHLRSIDGTIQISNGNSRRSFGSFSLCADNQFGG